jgi:serine/threonine protein kinase
VAPVYKPRAADVWSLGIVLINMYVIWVRLAAFKFFFWFRDLRSFSLVGSIIAILGSTRSRMVTLHLINIFPTRPTSLCGGLPA